MVQRRKLNVKVVDAFDQIQVIFSPSNVHLRTIEGLADLGLLSEAGIPITPVVFIAAASPSVTFIEEE